MLGEIFWNTSPCDAGDRRRRNLVAIPLRQIRVDHPLIAALRVTVVCRIGGPMFLLGILVVIAGRHRPAIPGHGPPRSG